MEQDPRCKKCKTPLLNEIELDTGFCENCLEIMAEKEQERREWNYYHNDI